MADEIAADVAIIGAGIAGAGIAAEISADLSCVILEQEGRPGYHSTGRSAAIFLRNYGNDVIRTLTRASAPLFEGRDPTLFPSPLLSPRGMLFVSSTDGLTAFSDLMSKSDGLREIGLDDAVSRFPILNREWLVAAAYEEDTQDIDVAALHEGWLRRARSNGTQVINGAPLVRAVRQGGSWLIETPAIKVKAATIVNAGGAWADRIAEACGVATLGLQPLRRSMAVLPAPEGFDIRGWPMLDDAREAWYCKPDGGRLFVSPAEEDPAEPHDAFADDMVLAEGLHRFEQAVTIEVTRLERSWAGLRTFAPDRTPVAGFDKSADGFFWLAGQGGYGIQTAPALSRLAGQLLRGLAPSADVEPVVAALSPNRFRGSLLKETIMATAIKRLHAGPRMSQAVIHGNTVYLAGQVGGPGKSVADQTKDILATVDKLLAEAGSHKSKILQAIIWLADMKDFGEMNAVWDKWVDGPNAPARATGEAKLAGPEYLVEIIITAAL